VIVEKLQPGKELEIKKGRYPEEQISGVLKQMEANCTYI
jgi:hypothetical protein